MKNVQPEKKSLNIYSEARWSTWSASIWLCVCVCVRHAFSRKSKQLQRHDSERLSSVYTDYSFSSCFCIYVQKCSIVFEKTAKFLFQSWRL